MSSSIVLSNFTLSKEDVISERLNVILQNFTANDAYVYGKFDEIPTIWKCLWYNDPAVEGYKKGDFFWLNTEDKSSYLKNNAEEIREAANANPMIINKLPKWKANDETIYNQYNNVLTGYIDDKKSSPMQPYAELGELSSCVQLVVSQKNNNKDLTYTSSWKKFLIDDDDNDQIKLYSISAVYKILQQHEYDYHFGEEREGINSYEFKSNLQNVINNLDIYVNKDFTGIAASYPQNYLKNDLSCAGFDTVEYFVKKPYPDRAINGFTVEHQWFRKWRSGFLEHGGFIKTENYLDTLNNKVNVNFNWDISGDSSKLFDIKYLADKNSKIIEIDESEDIPPGDNVLSVLYELDKQTIDQLYGKIETAPIYHNNDYNLNLTPVYKTAGLSSMADTDSYENLGNYITSRNVVNTAVKVSSYKKTGFSLDYDPVNTPRYYMYYATGFCTG